MKNEDIQLLPDTLLLLKVSPNSEERPMSRVIGYQTNQSILVTNPSLGKRQFLLSRNQEVVVSFFAKTSGYKFTSRVIHICTRPFPYLHLAYPDSIESGEIRKTQRLETQLPSRLVFRDDNGTTMVEGQISDISTSGIGFITPQDLEVSDQVITVRSTLPIADFSRALSIKGVIRSKNILDDENESFVYGIEFPDLLEEDYMLISSYIFSEIKDQTPFS